MTTAEIILFKQKALLWASKFEVCCLLDSNDFTDRYSSFDFLLAADAKEALYVDLDNGFEKLKAFYNLHRDWIFGLLTYDLKNEIEQLTSANPDGLQFPKLFFFVPKYLIAVRGNEITVILGDKDILSNIHHTTVSVSLANGPISVSPRMDREAYMASVKEIQRHISRGDVYELNYCQEFYAESAKIDPVAVYQKLTTVSPSPFTGFLKIKQQYVLSASPERFLCKRGRKLVSQPIKGTSGRSRDPQKDQMNKDSLKTNKKEQAENVMIVDLVRNDLTKNAVPGSVQVEELFGIYSFPQVHQMISTIGCQLRSDVHPIDAIKNVFPMGSMTGAPKVKAMQLIEIFEQSKRGAYSGALGYIDPQGDFDFSVIIRSILYSASSNYLSFQVGSAITYAADPELEYEECLLKASGILKTLQN